MNDCERFHFEKADYSSVQDLCENARVHGIGSFEHEELKGFGLALTSIENQCRRIKAELRREVLSQFGL